MNAPPTLQLFCYALAVICVVLVTIAAFRDYRGPRTFSMNAALLVWLFGSPLEWLCALAVVLIVVVCWLIYEVRRAPLDNSLTDEEQRELDALRDCAERIRREIDNSRAT